MKKDWIFKQLDLIAQKFNFKLTDSINKIPEEAIQMILYGGNESLEVNSKDLGVKRKYKIDFEGIANFIDQTFTNNDSTSLQRWAKEFMDHIDCPSCEGARLRKESLYFKVNEMNIAQLANMDIAELVEWFDGLGSTLSRKKNK